MQYDAGGLFQARGLVRFYRFTPPLDGPAHYYLGGGVVQNYYRAYLGDIKWSISLILCNKIYARVAQYYILRPFEIETV